MSGDGAARAFFALLARDLRLAVRNRGELVNPLLFYFIVATLFPLGVTSDAETLAVMGAGVLWIAALLATLLSLDSLFRSDFDDGTLELIMLSPHPSVLLVLAKVLAHWLVTGLPLLVVTPLLAVLMAVPEDARATLWLTLALGTPVLSLVGAIGVALTVGLRRGGALLSLLVLPLYVPVLIFGANAVGASAAGLPVTGQLYMLGALLALAVSLAPIATAAALRISID
ncbi:MAG: heme exporter protein CcmB [Gammaproteobacteria bacterium]|nr:heme exporter protein CcmB [Gammaproteobacteria bacterium]